MTAGWVPRTLGRVGVMGDAWGVSFSPESMEPLRPPNVPRYPQGGEVKFVGEKISVEELQELAEIAARSEAAASALRAGVVE
ncbi:hypothetical protein GCM10012275_42180 [Longimycelium tulufanense]|uniref:Uncharacterized protein n=1 Tax=Longimycelium tulufanense TaxID=907463 RepID=A0A8J3CHG8_9PSEU|nr:hypothetical protein GCM10012275_42180 [Longimycelium tulufanense]